MKIMSSRTELYGKNAWFLDPLIKIFQIGINWCSGTRGTGGRAAYAICIISLSMSENSLGSMVEGFADMMRIPFLSSTCSFIS